jgi:transposase InsO family protein
MRGKSFSFLPFEEEYTAFPTKLNDMEVWHKRLGHCHQQRMISMKKHDAVRGVPPFTDLLPNCNACQFSKQNRKPFPKSTWRSIQKLQLIHTDVAGPLSTPSIKGSRYYILFIDDFTRMCWIFFMKYKSEVAGIFWQFKKNVENKSSCRIQAIRSDNGKEYTSSEFNLYCEEAGIEHQFTALYTPEQNGVSKRRNQYIMEMVRCMLHEKNLPKMFWAETANTTVFLQNRLPTKLLEEKTPFEVWYNYKPSLSFLKIFGSICFVHVPQIKRDKLDNKAILGIFVGYSAISKAYKVYHP